MRSGSAAIDEEGDIVLAERGFDQLMIILLAAHQDGDIAITHLGAGEAANPPCGGVHLGPAVRGFDELNRRRFAVARSGFRTLGRGEKRALEPNQLRIVKPSRFRKQDRRLNRDAVFLKGKPQPPIRLLAAVKQACVGRNVMGIGDARVLRIDCQSHGKRSADFGQGGDRAPLGAGEIVKRINEDVAIAQRSASVDRRQRLGQPTIGIETILAEKLGVARIDQRQIVNLGPKRGIEAHGSLAQLPLDARGFLAAALQLRKSSVEFGGHAGLMGDGGKKLKLVAQFAEEMAEDHSSAAIGDFRQGGWAAFGEDFSGEVGKIEDSGAEISAKPAGAGELALGQEGGLPRNDPIDRRTQRPLSNRLNDPIEAPLGLAGPGPPENESHGHTRANNSLTSPGSRIFIAHGSAARRISSDITMPIPSLRIIP